jgi:hypothetical protein
VFAGPTVDRTLRSLAVILAAALFGGCAHVASPRPLATNDQLVASALSWAIRVPARASEYRVAVPVGYPRDAIVAAAAADTGLIRLGTTLRRAGEVALGESMHIRVEKPHRAPEGAAREFLVPFTLTPDGAKPTSCVVRIRLRSDDPRSWIYAPEGEEHCWPRPGAWSKP